MLPTQVIDIPIAGGIQTKIAEQLVDPPFVSLLENGIFDKSGRIAKRNGYRALPTTGWPSSDAHTLFDHFGELSALTNDEGIVRLSEKNARWSKPSAMAETESHPTIPVEVDRQPVARSPMGSAASVDVATVNGCVCYVWIDTQGTPKIYARVVELETGVTILGPVELTASGITNWSIVKVTYVSNTFLVLGLANASSRLTAWTLNTASTPMAFSAEATVSTGASLPLDVTTTGSEVHVAHSSGAADTILLALNASGTVTRTTTLTGVDCDERVAIIYHAADGKLWLANAWAAATTVQLRVYSTVHVLTNGPWTGITRIGAGIVQITIVENGAGYAWIVVEESANATNNNHVTWRKWQSSATAQSPEIRVYNTQIIAKGFQHGVPGRVYVPCAYYKGASNNTQPAGLLCTPYNVATTTGKIACVARYLVDQIVERIAYDLGNTVRTDATNGVWRTASAVLGGAVGIYGVDAAIFTLPGNGARVVKSGNNSYLASGLLYTYDGERPQETTPHWFAEAPDITLSTGVITAGAHQWCVVWEWTDAKGNVHRSAPSPASASTSVSGSQNATVSFNDLTIKARDGTTASNIRASLYRTLAGGTIYYLVKTEVPAAHATIAGKVKIVDNSTDTTISANGVLYTDGGVLPNDPPPPCLDAVVAKERMFVIDAEHRDTVWFTKLLSDTVAPEFSAALKLRVPQGLGTALASLDDKVVVFTSDGIFIVYGDGPNDTGQQDTFTALQPVPSPDGCISRASIVTIESGVMFQGTKGIHLLDRGLQVTFIGAPVEDILSTYTIASAAHLKSKGLVLFHLKGTSTVIVYDYFNKQWSKWTNHNAACAVIWGDKYTWMRSTGAAFQQDTSYADPSNTHISLKVRTAWLKVAGLEGFQRVRRAHLSATKEAAHGLTIKAGFDGDSSFAETHTFTEAEITALTRYEPGVHIGRQKCKRIRFEIEDSAPNAGPGAGYTAVGIALEIGAKKGINKLPAAARK